MKVMPVAASGMMNAQSRFSDSARRTAEAPLKDLEQETIERIKAKAAFTANAAVAKTADEMTGTLLDILT